MADAYHHVLREVNQPEGPFPPVSESWSNPDQSHVAIMGDPVLRSHPARPVTGLTTRVEGDRLALSWTNPAAADSDPDFLGCRVYRSRNIDGPYARVGEQTDPGTTSFSTRLPAAGPWHFMVRALRRQTTASASYENPAQGIFTTAEVEERSYEDWAVGLEAAGPEDDADFDGIPNLLAWAVGAADGLARETDRWPRFHPDGSFTVPVSWRTSVRYEIQFSLDLATWHAVAVKPAGGDWALNANSGYPNQANLTLAGPHAITVSENPSPKLGFWRLVVSRGS